MAGILVEFGGLPASGKSTLAERLATDLGAVYLRIDEIEAAMRRFGLAPAQTGVPAYAVAHDVAAGHLHRGLTVIVDAVNPVAEARDGWRHLAAGTGARHAVIEVHCGDPVEHRRRVETRWIDRDGWSNPDWDAVVAMAAEYQPRTDERLVVDTAAPLEECYSRVRSHVA